MTKQENSYGAQAIIPLNLRNGKEPPAGYSSIGEYIPGHNNETFFKHIYSLTATLDNSSQIIILVNENEARISKAGDNVDKKYEYYKSQSLYNTLKDIVEKGRI